jgi:hypothetical protein
MINYSLNHYGRVQSIWKQKQQKPILSCLTDIKQIIHYESLPSKQSAKYSTFKFCYVYSSAFTGKYSEQCYSSTQNNISGDISKKEETWEQREKVSTLIEVLYPIWKLTHTTTILSFLNAGTFV